MTVFKRTIVVSSSSRHQLIDITREVTQFVEDSRTRDGILMVSVPHATAAVIANENEGGLLNDILEKVQEVFPQSFEYEHNRIDDNADAHLAATFLGHSRAFPVEDQRLVRGTWQNIFIVELDGPRRRREVHLSLVS